MVTKATLIHNAALMYIDSNEAQHADFDRAKQEAELWYNLFNEAHELSEQLSAEL